MQMSMKMIYGEFTSTYQIEESHGTDAARQELIHWVQLGLANFDICSNIIHGHTTAKSSKYHKISVTSIYESHMNKCEDCVQEDSQSIEKKSQTSVKVVCPYVWLVNSALQLMNATRNGYLNYTE